MSRGDNVQTISTGSRSTLRACVAVSMLLLGGTGANAQPVPAMFRGGPSSRGIIVTTGVDRLGGLAWRFKTAGPIRSSPTVAEGVLYVGSSDGCVYALEARTGTQLWRRRIGSPVGGAPLVTRSRVVVLSRDNRILALRRSDGSQVWEFQGGVDLPLSWGWEGWDYLLASPVLAGDLVLAGTGDGKLYALDLDDGTVRWDFPTQGRVRSAPTVVDNNAYLGSGDGVIYGISLESGKEVWRFETAGHRLDASDWGFDRTQIYSSPTYADGLLYIGSRDASLYAVQISTAETLWTVQDGTAWVISSPAVNEGSVISARSSSGRIRALDARTGVERWSVATGGYVFSSPMIVGSTAYIGSGDGRVYALETSTGAVQWIYQTGGGIFSTPAVWEGIVYIGSDDGYLYALETTKGPQPVMTVYWDSTFATRSVWGRREKHKLVRDYFENLGYDVLDSAGLYAFLSTRIADGVPSAVVMAMDAVPSTIAKPDEECLLRGYLESGGKVVWMGLPPLVFVRDSSGRIAGVDRDRPSRLLGVDHRVWNTDEYGVSITHEGRQWGLTAPWVGMACVAPTADVVVLAQDELGRAAAWAKNYGGGAGTGYVFVRMGYDSAYLDEVRMVAEYGLLRARSASP